MMLAAELSRLWYGPNPNFRARFSAKCVSPTAQLGGQNLVVTESKMNVNLIYESGQSYSQRFSNLTVTVTRSGERIKVQFRDKENGHAYASFRLPFDQFKMLAHAGLIACECDVSPIEFTVNEESIRSIAA
jgi:regulation of enolase protein 1 (concanavalin A-like superfamily)